MQAAAVRRSVLVVGNLRYAKDQWAEFSQRHHVQFVGDKSPQDLSETLPSLVAERPYDALVYVYGSYLPQPINKKILGPLEPRLRFVADPLVGYNHVDLGWLNQIGAYHCNSPRAAADPVAQATVMLILQCIRRARELEEYVRRGDWQMRATKPTATPDARDVLVGIIGMGSIGSSVRDKVQALGMEVIYSNRKRLSVEEEKGAAFVSLEDLLLQADLIVLMCPLTDETYHLISTEQFQMMKDGVMIVNTSRVIDEAALVAALQSGKVDRAGLDVFEFEPQIHPYILASERCTLLPHHTGQTFRRVREVELEILENLDEWCTTGGSKAAVNRPKSV